MCSWEQYPDPLPKFKMKGSKMIVAKTNDPINSYRGKPYPKLMIQNKKNTNTIILALGENDESDTQGYNLHAVVLSSNFMQPGRVSSNFNKYHYVDYDGEITLRNE